MRLLLDTHAFLWFTLDDPRISASALSLISDPQNSVLLSIASVWEVAIKVRTGKLALTAPVVSFFETQLQHNHMDLLALEMRHLAPLATLPLHHRDPFDRLLIAQSIVEEMAIVSADDAFADYAVIRLW